MLRTRWFVGPGIAAALAVGCGAPPQAGSEVPAAEWQEPQGELPASQGDVSAFGVVLYPPPGFQKIPPKTDCCVTFTDKPPTPDGFRRPGTTTLLIQPEDFEPPVEPSAEVCDQTLTERQNDNTYVRNVSHLQVEGRPACMADVSYVTDFDSEDCVVAVIVDHHRYLEVMYCSDSRSVEQQDIRGFVEGIRFLDEKEGPPPAAE